MIFCSFFYFDVMEILPVSIVLNIMLEPSLSYYLHTHKIRENSIPFFLIPCISDTVSICFGLVSENSRGYL